MLASGCVVISCDACQKKEMGCETMQMMNRITELPWKPNYNKVLLG